MTGRLGKSKVYTLVKQLGNHVMHCKTRLVFLYNFPDYDLWFTSDKKLYNIDADLEQFHIIVHEVVLQRRVMFSCCRFSCSHDRCKLYLYSKAHIPRYNNIGRYNI